MDQTFSKVSCPHCGVHIEYPADVPLAFVPCPKCAKPVQIGASSPDVAETQSEQSARKVAAFDLSNRQDRDTALYVRWFLAMVVGVVCLAIFGAINESRKRKELDAYLAIGRLKKETLLERVERFAAEAKQELTNCCSEHVVGFRRIVRYEIKGLGGDNPDKWRGEAEVEFVNKVGGIERTNLPLVFRIPLRESLAYPEEWHVACQLDYMEVGRRKSEALHRQLEEIIKGH